MANRKVRVSGWYIFEPVMLDVCDPKTTLKSGARVQVRNLHGAPKANTMGHCHVFDEHGAFAGLVCCNSLQPEVK